jgi:hypothetical protein
MTHGSPVRLINFQVVTKLRFVTSRGLKKVTQVGMCECSQRCTLAQNISWDFLLCFALPAQRTFCQPVFSGCYVFTVNCILLKDSTLVSAATLGSEISSRACRWMQVGLRCRVLCWLSSQPMIFRLIFCVEIPRAGSGSTSRWAEPSLSRSRTISFPPTPEFPGT